jgi:transcription elongation factor
MENWKTTAAGAGAAVLNAWATGGMDGRWQSWVASAAIALIGYFARDAEPKPLVRMAR